jgi:hypothetical protein
LEEGEIMVPRKHMQIIGCYLTLILIVALSLVAASCSSTSTPTLTSPPPPTLSSILVTPASADLAVGATRQFTATGTYSDDSIADITSQVTWASSNNMIAAITSAGLATGIAVGNTNITATLSGTTSPSVNLSIVTTPTLSSIEIQPESPANLTVGSTGQLTAIGTYSDGSTEDITSQVTWTIYDTAIATVSSAGLATGVMAGNAYITAALSIVTSRSVSLTVVNTPTSP